MCRETCVVQCRKHCNGALAASCPNSRRGCPFASFVSKAAKLNKDVLLDMAWELKEDFDFVSAVAGQSKTARQMVETIREQISRHGRYAPSSEPIRS